MKNSFHAEILTKKELLKTCLITGLLCHEGRNANTDIYVGALGVTFHDQSRENILQYRAFGYAVQKSTLWLLAAPLLQLQLRGLAEWQQIRIQCIFLQLGSQAERKEVQLLWKTSFPSLRSIAKTAWPISRVFLFLKYSLWPRRSIPVLHAGSNAGIISR